ncbi:MAG: alanine dehydrogenase [Rhodothermales bacterium]|nr:alanine dehydrogenase [Rhodothermales bacterium]MBO6778425.1 alanine dehydrogenase [Rhodothermales bacterium]
MEVPALQGLGVEHGLQTLEQRAKVGERHKSLRIGVPLEVSNEERRVALAPSGVSSLVSNGHQVYVQEAAGKQANFSDQEYAEAGGEIVREAGELYSNCGLIVKVGPPSDDECAHLQEKQILISALHLGGTSPEFLRCLMDLGITGIGFEFIRDQDGTLPIVRMMHEIMGSMAVQISARYLESGEGGKGVMLGGISGVPPSTVVILGAGVVGEWAARTALGFGAHVIVLDNDLSALRVMEHYLDRRITTAMATEGYIRHALERADVVIGAMMKAGQRSPVMITEEMVMRMPKGAVIVDAMMDQGGCCETSAPTTHSQPSFVKHGVIHYCIPNMPSNAARTATYALTNVLVPYLLKIGEAGTVHEALWRDVGLRNGTYVYRRHLTKKSLATMFGMPHRDIELLIASGI